MGDSSKRAGRWAGWLLAAAILGGCAHVREPVAPAADALAWGDAWQHYRLPGKVPTEFRHVTQDGRQAVRADAASAVSMLRHPVQVPPAALGDIEFSWKVPRLIEQADLGQKDRADSPVRIVLAFEGDRSRLSAKDQALSELARALTGEEMPYATLMYVWCNVRQPGTVIHGPRTDRIRKIVVESGAGNLNRWMDYRRDIRADFERAFGEAPGPLVGIAIMTDSDNTRSQTRAWYGQPRLVPAGARPGS